MVCRASSWFRRCSAPRPGHVRAAERGFALPIAVAGALVLLLGSSSLQLLSLQNRAQLHRVVQRQQIEDLLASAAQQTAAALQQTGGGCLLAKAHDAWTHAAAECAIEPEVLKDLQQGQVGSSRYRLTAYQPDGHGIEASSAQLELQLLAERPWRAAYRLALVPSSDGQAALQITAVQEQGLRGVGA